MQHTHRYTLDLIWQGAHTRTYESYTREHRVRINGKPELIGTADPLFRGDPALHNPEDLLLAARVPPFTRRAQRATVAHPKFYWFDAGVFRSLRPSGPLDRPEEIAGAALEGLVFQHLRQWCAWRAGAAHTVSYWRTRTGLEVDFVVYGPEQFLAIEVKHSGTVRARDLASLRAFREAYPEATPLLLYRGSEPLEIDGIRCVPVDQWLRAVRPDRLLSGGS